LNFHENQYIEIFWVIESDSDPEKVLNLENPRWQN